MRFQPQIFDHQDRVHVMILQGEHDQLDFKQTISSQEKIARTLAAFANGNGGSILVGVNDGGAIVGCDAEQEMYMLHEAAEHFCDPPVDLDFILHEENDKTVVEAKVKKSLKKPHLAQDDHDIWKIYVRKDDKTMFI